MYQDFYADLRVIHTAHCPAFVEALRLAYLMKNSDKKGSEIGVKSIGTSKNEEANGVKNRLKLDEEMHLLIYIIIKLWRTSWIRRTIRIRCV